MWGPTRSPAASAAVRLQPGPTCSPGALGWSVRTGRRGLTSSRRCGSSLPDADRTSTCWTWTPTTALVSHLPQLVASALAADLVTAPTDLLDLAGTGLRDLVRIAASDAALWAQIVSTNATAVAEDLGRLLRRLQSVATALGGLDAGAAATAALIQEGNAGYSRLPGKHGSREPDRFAVVSVVVADRPGELARLLTDAGTAGINIEDLAMEHAPGLPVGVAELFTDPAGAARLRAHLRAGGWSVSG